MLLLLLSWYFKLLWGIGTSICWAGMYLVVLLQAGRQAGWMSVSYYYYWCCYSSFCCNARSIVKKKLKRNEKDCMAALFCWCLSFFTRKVDGCCCMDTFTDTHKHMYTVLHYIQRNWGNFSTLNLLRRTGGKTQTKEIQNIKLFQHKRSTNTSFSCIDFPAINSTLSLQEGMCTSAITCHIAVASLPCLALLCLDCLFFLVIILFSFLYFIIIIFCFCRKWFK